MTFFCWQYKLLTGEGRETHLLSELFWGWAMLQLLLWCSHRNGPWLIVNESMSQWEVSLFGGGVPPGSLLFLWWRFCVCDVTWRLCWAHLLRRTVGVDIPNASFPIATFYRLWSWLTPVLSMSCHPWGFLTVSHPSRCRRSLLLPLQSIMWGYRHSQLLPSGCGRATDGQADEQVPDGNFNTRDPQRRSSRAPTRNLHRIETITQYSSLFAKQY